MSKTMRVQSLKKIVGIQEEQIEKELSKIVAQYEYEKNKLLELISYRKEYEDRQRSSFNQGMTAQTAYQQRLFIAQISQGIERQQARLVQMSQEMNQNMQVWKVSHLKTKAVDSMLGRYQKLDLLQENKFEQREQDDRIRLIGRRLNTL